MQLIDLDSILKKYRMGDIDDVLVDGMRLNRLFGLQDLIKENLNLDSIVCELGSHMGASGSLFAYYCKQVYCVDIWGASNAELVFDMTMADFDNVTKIKNTSVNASFTFPNNYFDLVYIDASHTYKDVTDDIIHWKSKVKKNGFLAGHDYNHSSTLSEEVIKAVVEQLGEPDNIYEDSSWTKRLE